MTKWNQEMQGNAHVSDGAEGYWAEFGAPPYEEGLSDGAEGYWAEFPEGTSAQAVLDDYMSTADYSGATKAFVVTAEIGGQVAQVRVQPV